MRGWGLKLQGASLSLEGSESRQVHHAHEGLDERGGRWQSKRTTAQDCCVTCCILLHNKKMEKKLERYCREALGGSNGSQ